METDQPKTVTGKPAAPGIGLGKARILEEYNNPVRPQKIDEHEIDEQLAKFQKAKKSVEFEYEKIRANPGEFDVGEIIEAQIQTLNDPEVSRNIRDKITKEHYSVDYAIFSTFNEYIQLLEASGVAWANDRSIDVISIRDELIRAAKDEKSRLTVYEGEIVFADNISPVIMVKLSRFKIAGIVIEKGGQTSHAVILSQSLGIPCVINAHWNRCNLKNGNHAIIDGSTGRVILEPACNEVLEYEKKKKDESDRFRKALTWAQKPHQTKCGTEFTLRANVEFLEELPRLNTHGAKGVGLLRTETLLFETREFNVDDQIDFYTQVVKAADGETVTIRLFDAGGDKLLENTEHEANPFLGWRGVRMLLDEKALLHKQLEAIYRVSGMFKGKVRVLIPMVSRLDEVYEVKQICEDVKKSLAGRGIPFDDNLKTGIMVEVPGIALIAERAAREVDFFSIGTNDLTQYTLAVDRGNEKISGLFDSFHPAIWQLIKITKEGADKHGIPVTVCGEMASKPEAAACLVGMGISDLSMNAGSLPFVKSVLCSHTMAEMEQLSRRVLKANEIDEVHSLLKKWRAGS